MLDKLPLRLEMQPGAPFTLAPLLPPARGTAIGSPALFLEQLQLGLSAWHSEEFSASHSCSEERSGLRLPWCLWAVWPPAWPGLGEDCGIRETGRRSRGPHKHQHRGTHKGSWAGLGWPAASGGREEEGAGVPSHGHRKRTTEQHFPGGQTMTIGCCEPAIEGALVPPAQLHKQAVPVVRRPRCPARASPRDSFRLLALRVLEATVRPCGQCLQQ